MELHALYRELPVAQTHHSAVRCLRGHLQAVRQTLPRHHQGVVPGGHEGLGKTLENRAPVVVNLRYLPMHDGVGPHDLAAEGLPDGLVAETHAEDGDLARQGLDPTFAAQAVLAAVVVNTLVKAGMAVVLGSEALGRAVAFTLVPAAVLGAVAWILL